jgi:hypothetical protein
MSNLFTGPTTRRFPSDVKQVLEDQSITDPCFTGGPNGVQFQGGTTKVELFHQQEQLLLQNY